MENVNQEGKKLIRNLQLAQISISDNIKNIDRNIEELENEREAKARRLSEIQEKINMVVKEYSQ